MLQISNNGFKSPCIYTRRVFHGSLRLITVAKGSSMSHYYLLIYTHMPTMLWNTKLISGLRCISKRYDFFFSNLELDPKLYHSNHLLRILVGKYAKKSNSFKLINVNVPLNNINHRWSQFASVVSHRQLGSTFKFWLAFCAMRDASMETTWRDF